ncbi:MAG: aminopeptidase, partial [Desulfurococcales archaeon]|nr:aminopeptidase [Desulfurococcales archaeon]
LKEGERVLILNDYPARKDWESMGSSRLEVIVERSLLAKAVYEIGREAFYNNEFSFRVYSLTGMHGAEPPSYVADLMKDADVVIAITTYSLSHTNAREKATSSGVRVASMPGFTAHMFEPGGPMAADYLWIKDTSERVAEWLKGRKEVHITNEFGTNIYFSIEGRAWHVDTGLYTKPGEWGNLPAGEVYIAPLEGTANGVFVAPAGWYPNLKEDMKFYVRDGRVHKIEGGGEVGDNFRNALGLEPRNDDDAHVSRRNIAELGIGTNPNAKRADNVLEAEKILGTVHIAIGDNSHFGGRNPSDLHEDFVQPKPTVIVDGEVFMKDGKITILD